MDLETLAQLGEFASGVVVIVSLVYLAVQVRQNTSSLRAENYARTLENISAMQTRLSDESDLGDLFSKGVADASALSARERIRLSWFLYEMFGAFEFMFHQARADALPGDVWARWRGTIDWWPSFPGVRAWWHGRPSPFTESFTVFVEERIRAAAVDPSQEARWQHFLATGTAPVPPDVPA